MSFFINNSERCASLFKIQDAMQKSDTNAVEALLKKDIPVDSRIGNFTLLQLAVLHGYSFAIVTLLIQYGADITVLDNFGKDLVALCPEDNETKQHLESLILVKLPLSALIEYLTKKIRANPECSTVTFFQMNSQIRHLTYFRAAYQEFRKREDKDFLLTHMKEIIAEMPQYTETLEPLYNSCVEINNFLISSKHEASL